MNVAYPPRCERKVMLILKSKARDSSSFISVPTGMHLARCFRIIDLGTQKTTYLGKDKFSHKILVQFEIHSENADGSPLLTEKGEPLSISKRYTYSTYENASICKDIESWRGSPITQEERDNGINLQNFLGMWAMLNVTKDLGKDNKEYTNIKTVNPVPGPIRKLGLPEPHNEVLIYSIDKSPQEVFDKLSENVKTTIQGSPEWQRKFKTAPERPSKTPIQNFPDDDFSNFNDDPF